MLRDQRLGTDKPAQCWLTIVLSAALLALAWPANSTIAQQSPSASSGAATSTPDQSSAPHRTPEQTAQLDELLAALKAASNPRAATAIVLQIWEIWSHSGSDEVDRLMHKAHVQIGFGEHGAALALLDQVVAAAPHFVEGWNRRATLLYMMREYERSLADIDRVLQLEPRHFGALSGRGLCRLAKGEPREALEAFRKALSINPFLTESRTVVPQLERLLEGDPT